MSNRVSNRVSNGLSNGVSNGVSNRVSNGVSNRVSNRVCAGTRVRNSMGLLAISFTLSPAQCQLDRLRSIKLYTTSKDRKKLIVVLSRGF